MDQYSSNKEGEAHDHFSYQQQQQQEAAAGRPFSRHGLLSPSHPPQTRDWFATSAEDNTCFESSSNFMEENGGDDVRRRIEHQQQSSSNSYYNSSQALAIEQIEKEPMFDKVVTPSDVGKLNRLVIPKQHAEKYFPLDSSANEKGLLLNFEDRTRKLWRFRYSYWNSSQSYVMTKGWSRFVKEKKLDAGDIVSFQRGVGEAFRGRLFIDWRRRPSSNPLLFHHHDPSSLSFPHRYFPFHQARSTPCETSSTPLYLRPLAQLTSGHHNYNNQSHPYNHYPYQQLQQGQCNPYNNNNGVMSYNPYGVGSSSQTLLYLRSSAEESPRGDSTVVHPRAERKKLRLFGVNMECDNQRSSVEESDNLSSSPTPATASPPPESPRLQDHDTTNEKSKRSMSLSLSF